MTTTTALRYQGYSQRDVPLEDPELTHVGPGTPCGEYIRRAWQPVIMSSEISDLPVPVRMLGEDLVVFRDGTGEVGLLHRHCMHRGASLEYGIIMDHGIKCCYHGWHYGVDGSIIDLPSEPADSPIRTRFAQGAYPVVEHQGIVFAYLGPPAQQPEFPVYDTMCVDGVEAVAFSISTPCNWLQVYENTQDPIHVLHLHTRSSGVQFGVASGVTQEIDYRETPLGMMNVQARRVGDNLWCRTVDTILPNGNQTGAIWEEADEEKTFLRCAMLRWMVPVDDTHTVCIGWRFFSKELDPEGMGDRSAVGKESIDFIGQTQGRDREVAQRQPGDFEAQVSQRDIAVHSLEHRATSDRGVVMLRGLVREGIRAVRAGGDLPRPDHSPVSTFTQDTIHRFPLGPEVPVGSEAEQTILTRFGASVGEVVVASNGEPPEVRRTTIKAACDRDFATPGS